MAQIDKAGFLRNRLKYIGIIAVIFSASCTLSGRIYSFFEQRLFHSWVQSSPILAPIVISVLLFLFLLLVFIIIGFLLESRAHSILQRIANRKNAEQNRKFAEKEMELAEKHKSNRVLIGRWFEKQCEAIVRLYVRTLIRELSIELQYLKHCFDTGHKRSPIGLDHLANSCRIAREISPICNLQEYPEILKTLQGDPEELAIRKLSEAIAQSFDQTYQLLVGPGNQKEACIHKVVALIEDITRHIVQIKGVATDLQKA